jgi:hypothetical protein
MKKLKILKILSVVFILFSLNFQITNADFSDWLFEKIS